MLHPSAQAFLEQRKAAGIRPNCELSVVEARAQAIAMIALKGQGEPVHEVQDRVMTIQGVTLPIRLYKPVSDTCLPILVYFHGGGWVTGDLDVDDKRCRMLANGAHCVVVSVNYRHAPEHKFPVPAEDAYRATRWVAENGHTINGDPTQIAVGGASAGGNLAAVVTLMARDRATPQLQYQLLMVPITDYGMGRDSYREFADGYGLTRDAMVWYWNHYLNTPADGDHPHASPFRARSLAGLPRAHVVTAECDPLRDEGEAYAARLQRAGVPVVLTRGQGMVHQFWGEHTDREIVRELGQAFQRG